MTSLHFTLRNAPRKKTFAFSSTHDNENPFFPLSRSARTSYYRAAATGPTWSSLATPAPPASTTGRATRWPASGRTRSTSVWSRPGTGSGGARRQGYSTSSRGREVSSGQWSELQAFFRLPPLSQSCRKDVLSIPVYFPPPKPPSFRINSAQEKKRRRHRRTKEKGRAKERRNRFFLLLLREYRFHQQYEPIH